MKPNKWKRLSLYFLPLAFLVCFFGLTHPVDAASNSIWDSGTRIIDQHSNVTVTDYYTIDAGATYSSKTFSVLNPYNKDNEYLICRPSKSAGAATLSSITYAGQTLTVISSTAVDKEYYLKNPEIGTNNLTFNWSASNTADYLYSCWFVNGVSNLNYSIGNQATSNNTPAPSSCSDYDYFNLGSNSYTNNFVLFLFNDQQSSYFPNYLNYYCNLGNEKLMNAYCTANSCRGEIVGVKSGNLNNLNIYYYNKSSSVTKIDYLIFTPSNAAPIASYPDWTYQLTYDRQDLQSIPFDFTFNRDTVLTTDQVNWYEDGTLISTSTIATKLSTKIDPNGNVITFTNSAGDTAGSSHLYRMAWLRNSVILGQYEISINYITSNNAIDINHQLWDSFNQMMGTSSAASSSNPLNLDAHHLACSDSQWSDGNIFMQAWCRMAEFGLWIPQKISESIKSATKLLINQLSYIFPFTVPITISNCWTNALSTSLPSELSWLIITDSNGDVTMNVPDSLSGSTNYSFKVWGPSIFASSSTPTLTTALVNFRTFTTYLIYLGLIALIIDLCYLIIKDISDEYNAIE